MRINGETHYAWHEGEVLEVLATKDRDQAAALKPIKRLMRRCGPPQTVVSDGPRSYTAAMKEIGNDRR